MGEPFIMPPLMSGVFKYPPNPPILVQSWDVLAASQPDERESIVVVHYIDHVQWLTVRYQFGTTFFTMANLTIQEQLVLVYPIIGNLFY